MAESNVVYPRFITTLDIPAERVLKGALEANLESCVVLGYDAEGNEYMASSIASGSKVTWLLERCKYRLLSEGE